MLKRLLGREIAKRLLARDHDQLILAALIGLLAGCASTGFRWMIEFIEKIFSSNGLTFIGLPDNIHWMILPLLPMIGGLIIGVICKFFPNAVEENGVHRVMESVALEDGKIHPRTILSCSTTSAITIGTGGSAGREGPTVQIGAAIGSFFGQFFNQSTDRIRVLVGCGASAAIAASFNAPLAGVLFSLEIILRDFAISAFSPIVIASVIGTVVGRAIEGNYVTFQVPVHQLVSSWEIIFYFILGLLCGVAGFLFVKAYFFFSDFFAKKVSIPQMLKPALGGLIIGIISIWTPQVMGNGYEAMQQALNGEMIWTLAFLLIFLKIGSTAITLGSGGLGGIFAPALFIGAMLGSAFGAGTHFAFPSLSASPETYAVVGMGAVAGAVMQAPLTNILMLFELTNDYTLILPIMMSCIVASYTMQILHQHSIYFEKLLKKGINIQHGREVSILNSFYVRDVMTKKVVTLPQDTPFRKILEIVSRSKSQHFPVVDKEGHMTGILAFSDMREMILEEGLGDLVVANDISTKNVVSLTPSKNLNEAMELFADMDFEQLPVVHEDNPTIVIGMIARGDVMNVYNREVLVAEFDR
jgi:chloride channel protein, CIC family